MGKMKIALLKMVLPATTASWAMVPQMMGAADDMAMYNGTVCDGVTNDDVTDNRVADNVVATLSLLMSSDEDSDSGDSRHSNS